MTPVEEPLLESAPLAWQLAPQLCREDPGTGENCAWHHGFWQYLRLMGLASTPAHHADFYLRAFQAMEIGEKAPRILVSGSSDYSMLAHVLAGFRACGTEPVITVIDACETPLFLNRWYAGRTGCRIETVRCDVRDYEPAASFDLICTHSFLFFFSAAERGDLLKKWRQLLRPGGKALTVTRLRAGAAPERVGFAPEQAQAFCARVTHRAAALREQLMIDPPELAAMAGIYASRHVGWPVRSRDDIRDLFEGARFQVDELSSAPPAPSAGPGVSGVAVPGSDEHLQIIATRL